MYHNLQLPTYIFATDSFDVRLSGGATPNAGHVEVKYVDTWSGVCYERYASDTSPWSFVNAEVVCKELGYPGALFARRGDRRTRRSWMTGYKCRRYIDGTGMQTGFLTLLFSCG